jgi:thiol-disulfide isomerase/thioredoxin
MRKFAYLILLVFFFTFSAARASALAPCLSLRYFFSASCPHCIAVEPIIKKLSTEFEVRGLLYGKGDAGPKPFAVEKGDKKISSEYGVTGVPTLVVLENGAFRMKISGERDIKDAPAVLKALQKGALTVSETVEKGAGEGQRTVGWVVSKGDYFKNAKFFLTDRKKTIIVRPWLPLETVKSRFKKARPRLMSDAIGGPVMLVGELIGSNGDYQFSVKEEVLLDER